MEVIDCNYPDCGCDWDAICETEVHRREPVERLPWLGKFAVGGIALCAVALAVIGCGALWLIGAIVTNAIQ